MSHVVYCLIWYLIWLVLIMVSFISIHFDTTVDYSDHATPPALFFKGDFLPIDHLGISTSTSGLADYSQPINSIPFTTDCLRDEK